MTHNDEFNGVRVESEAIEALDTSNKLQPECPTCATKSVKDTLWFMFVQSVIASLFATAIWAGGNFFLSSGKQGPETDVVNTPVKVQIGVENQDGLDLAIHREASDPR